MKRFIGLSAALVLILTACGEEKESSTPAANGGAPTAALPADGTDWTQTVTETEEGGFVMGNPNAPVKLVEYASYTCPHCAEFAEQATPTLRDQYVKSGKLSWEFRPFLLFPTDPGVSMLVRCQGPGASFVLADQLYATQQEWVGRLQTLPQQQMEQIQGLPPQQRMAAFVRASGLDQFFRQRGMPEARINSCLADQKGLERIAQITQRGSSEYKVQGTPTFFINGELIEQTSTWKALQPALQKALGQ